VLLSILINGVGLRIFIKMNILITGSTGFLGGIIRNVLQHNYSILGLSRSNSDYNIELQSDIPEFIEDFDIVIHAAGKAHSVPKNDKENAAFFDVNVQGTQNLLSGIKLSGKLPKSFVFISTVAVYGVNQGENINENSSLLAKDPYGLSKIQAELLVLNWCKENNVTCTILRLPLLVGENPPGNLGAMIHGIKKGYYFNIAGGLARKSIVLAEDVANILLKASDIGGVYNLTDGSHPSFYELSNAIAKQCGKSKLFNLPFIIAKSIASVGDIVGTKFPLNSNKLKKITTDLTFDDSKAREVLGWNPRSVINWYR
jgi:nucleoside-diphosphate-sugar epimerase